MDFIKKHKLTAFIILAYIIVIGFGFFIYNMFIGQSGLPVYGDRLDGIEDVPITDEQLTKIESLLSSDDIVVSASKPTLNGKILQVIITVGDTVTVDAAKALTTKVNEVLTDEQNGFYDIQVFISKNYNCSLVATGKIDEEGNFTENVTVKFDSDLSQSENISNFGISNSEAVDYNSNQEYEITEDGTYTIYGFTRDKVGETTCNIKIIKKSGEEVGTEDTIQSLANENFPIIGYKRKSTNDFVWTKER